MRTAYSKACKCLPTRNFIQLNRLVGSLRSQRSQSRDRTTSASFTIKGMSIIGGQSLFLDDFAHRQFGQGHAAQLDCSKEHFLEKVQELVGQGKELVDGYAPFCKHIFIPNFTSATLNALKITVENIHLINSGYSKRRPDELAVLTRWFPADKVTAPKAKFLDLILYSREQLVKEHDAMQAKSDSQLLPPAPWGIISIKPQDEDFETPMQPITIMRNALGREEGGSGVSLDKAAYDASVMYWQHHAPVISGPPAGE